MSQTQTISKKWTCDRCGVTVSRIDGEAAQAPDSWASSADGQFCLVCRREQAAEAALDSAPSDSPVAERAKRRRTALIEFEVSRTPEHADGVIARACRTSVSAVTKARRNLKLPDPPPPSQASRAKQREVASR
ncbi:MAG TPA: hypothetical protein VGC63_05955 [Solirubrobacterales bacterium]|jgi:hypothetical protein